MKNLFTITLLLNVLISFGQKEKERYTYSITKFIKFLESDVPGAIHEVRSAHIKLDARIEFNADSTEYKIVGEDAELTYITRAKRLHVNRNLRGKDFSMAIFSFANCKFDDLIFIDCK
jgi:hypothetical protein